jgi:IclR family transcriptional regulator, mhp operon transcriptional activator
VTITRDDRGAFTTSGASQGKPESDDCRSSPASRTRRDTDTDAAHLNRSLGRGLRILNILNSDMEHSVASLARDADLPRTTTFRILRTLIAEGFVRRDAVADTFHPTAMVRGLSDGFDDNAWLVQVARPWVAELARKVAWPVSIAALSGMSVLVRHTTDENSPTAVVRYTPGARIPLGSSASGLGLLAFSRPHQRRMLIDLMYQPSFAREQTICREEFERRVQEVAEMGYAWLHRRDPVSEQSSLALPIQAGEDALCVLVVRFAGPFIRQHAAVEKFLPAMRQAANSVVRAFGSERTVSQPQKIAVVTGSQRAEPSLHRPQHRRLR